MKIGRLIVGFLKWRSQRDARRRRRKFPPHGQYRERLNVPYIPDINSHHQYDVIYAKENRKNCCIIDIHGGSYIFGDHEDNYHFGLKFVEKGFDFISIDYIPNDGRGSVKELIQQCATCINVILSNLKQLQLTGDTFALTGDSAGGHLALILSQAIENPEIAANLGISFPKDFKLVATLLNCPVYDFVHLGDGLLNNSGKKRIIGPDYKNEEALKLISPNQYIDYFKGPLFLSTCKQDFLLSESLKLKEDMEKKDNVFKFVFIDSDEKHVAHVHNVLWPEHPRAKEVNDQMADFISSLL